MKNFAKVSLMIAGILFTIGCVFGLIGSLAGGRTLAASIKEDVYWNHKMELWIDKAEIAMEHMFGGNWWYGQNNNPDKLIVNGETVNIEEHVTEASVNTEESSQQEEALTKGSGENQARMGSGKGNWYQVDAAMVREMELEVGAGTFLIEEKETEDGTIDIYIEGAGGCNYKVKGTTLHIEGFTGIKTLAGNMANENIIIVNVPKDSYFDKIDIEIGAGIMSLSNLQAGKMEAEVGAGELDVYHVEADRFSADIGMGTLEVSQMQVKDAEINVGMGECVYEGSITGNLEAECDMGNMEFILDGSETDHNYKIECSMGNVTIGRYSFSALGTEKMINNNASGKFDIECNVGNIEIHFMD